MKQALFALLVAVVLAGCGSRGSSPTPNVGAENEPLSAVELQELSAGWKTNFARHKVSLREFQSGGPGKDGIPALDRPRFLHVTEAGFLRPREPVIALTLAGRARAYPLQILVWHEIVNDVVAGVPVAVTFCPLCNTAIAFDRRVGRRTLSFGTTGNLRNSDLVMYDRQTESWWQQFGGEGVVGRYAGTRLRTLPARIVAWRSFRSQYPDGVVLSRETGYSRRYGENPYVGYDDVSSPPFFPTHNAKDERLPPKERVVFIERGDAAVAIPFSILAKRRRVDVTVAGHRFEVRWQGGVSSALDTGAIASGRDVGAAQVFERGRPTTFAEPFWFAVAAFRPNVEIVGRSSGTDSSVPRPSSAPDPRGACAGCRRG
ncbi:MAG: DUF3179 domain-containing protein [Actinobacteria bacterium]|nr:DUF3179 domain-containing protein [Actinomycetota bacterium]